MGVNVKSKLCVSRSLLLTSLLVVILASFCFISVFNGVSSFALGVSDKIVNNESELRNAVKNAIGSTVIRLDKDIQLTESLNITKNKDITLTSNKASGYYKLIGVHRQSTIVVETGGTLKLDGISVTHLSGEEGSGVTVQDSGTLIMINGEISSNSATVFFDLAAKHISFGGGVDNRGFFEMYGGKISNNYAYNGYGGGVYNIGTFIMYGGEITNNTAPYITSTNLIGYGGGVYNIGIFTNSGGKIFGNAAGLGGDNVYPDDNGESSVGDGGPSSGGNGGEFGGEGGFSNGDNGTSVDNNGGGPFGGGFSLRAVVIVCVGVVAVSMCVIVFVLLFSSQKRLYHIET